MYYVSLAVIALLFVWRIRAGFRNGMVHEVISMIAMGAAGFCVVLLLGAISSYFQRQIGETVQFVSVLFVVCLVYRFVSIFLTSAKLISKLPIIHWLDKLLGAFAGAAEAGILTAFFIRFVKNLGLSFLA